MNTKGTTRRKINEVNVSKFEGTVIVEGLEAFNAGVREWNASIDREIAKAKPAPKTPSTLTTILKTWVGWALFLAASSLAGVVIEAVTR